MPSQKIRFEVFKRDLFRCQYCGRTPPDVVLEVDHVIAKSKGGKDSIDNYLTSCFDCNRGKGNNDLAVAPESLDNKLLLIKERQKQLKEYNKLLESLEIKYKEMMDAVDNHFSNHFEGKYSLSDRFRNVTLKKFVKQLPLQSIINAMDIACNSINNDDPNNTIRYFCGICWNWIKKPETRDW